MPDGPYVHRAAAALRASLLGRPVSVRALLAALAPVEAALDGRTLRAVDAVGKHLLAHATGGPALHVHLGVRGALLIATDAPPDDAVLRFGARDGGGARWSLRDPHRCELYDDEAVTALLGRLGADPLLRPDPTVATLERLRTTALPIGAALLDQGIVAGVGNDLRAEVLHACGIHPERAPASLDDRELDDLWRTLARMMAAARDDERALEPPGASGGEHHREHRVYRRKRCARCGLRVKRTRIFDRTAYFCPRCQR